MEPLHPSELSNDERRRRERPLWRWGLVISVLIHAVVLLRFPVQSVLLSPDAAAGPRAGDDRAAAGGMQAVNVRTPPVAPVVPPPIPVPVVRDLEPVEFEEDPQPSLERPAVDGNALSSLPGPGLEDGEGAGDGGRSDEGRFRLEAPVPRSVMFPSAPDDDRVRGREVEVWVFVDARGRVVPDSTRLRPPTPNGDFNRRLVRDAAEWSFDPARRDGQPVASWFNYRFTLGG